MADTLLDYVPQPDPSGHMPCSIALASLDRSFEEERRSRALDVQVESALPLSPVLLGVQTFLDRHLQGRREEDPIYDLSESLVSFKLSRGDRLERERGFRLAQPRMFGCNPRSYRVRASKEHRESYLVVSPVVDRDYSQFSALPMSDLRPAVEESMVGEQLKMLSYADYALAVGLRSADATGAKAADSADRAREAIQVGLRAIEHAAGIALKVRANLELARRDKALAALSFDSDTKAQLRTLPLGHEELFGGKLDEASKQAEE